MSVNYKARRSRSDFHYVPSIMLDKKSGTMHSLMHGRKCR